MPFSSFSTSMATRSRSPNAASAWRASREEEHFRSCFSRRRPSVASSPSQNGDQKRQRERQNESLKETERNEFMISIFEFFFSLSLDLLPIFHQAKNKKPLLICAKRTPAAPQEQRPSQRGRRSHRSAVGCCCCWQQQQQQQQQQQKQREKRRAYFSLSPS